MVKGRPTRATLTPPTVTAFSAACDRAAHLFAMASGVAPPMKRAAHVLECPMLATGCCEEDAPAFGRAFVDGFDVEVEEVG